MMLSTRSLRNRASAGALAIGLFAATCVPAFAQDSSPAQATSAETEQQDTTGAGETAASDAGEEIVVTGTNISGVKQVGSETIVIGREQVLATGKSTVADVLRTLPQVQNAGGSFNSTNNATRGEAINLRGIGQGATLTLVDGHRVTPSGTASAFTEANQVPLAAVERIEVIADGASAIYGSDAIAGVINYVIRKDFTGVELGGRFTAGAFGNDEWALSGTAGTHWSTGFGEGSIIATFEHSHRDPYLRGRNPRLRQDQRPFGGGDGRIQRGSTTANGASITAGGPGALFVPTVGNVLNPNFTPGGAFNYYVLPDNPTGRRLTLADLAQVSTGACGTPTCASYPNVVDSADYTDYQGEQTRNQAAVFVSQEIGAIKFYDQFFWNKSEQNTLNGTNGYAGGSPIVYVDPSNPNYIAGLPNTVRSSLPGVFPAVPQPLAVVLNLRSRLPADYQFINATPDESFNNTIGARASLFGDWKGEAYYTFGQDKSCGICYLGNYITFAVDSAHVNLLNDPIGSAPQLGGNFQSPLQNAIDAGLINPFSTAPLTQAQIDLISSDNYQYAQNWSHDVVAKVDGTLFDLPAGPVKGAFGGEYYAGIQKLQNGANRPGNPASVVTPDANARTVRKQHAAFAELYIPVIGREMNVPLVQSLTISAAYRYDHYSDFGGTKNGKISATWKVDDDLGLRGSYGTSFRAPGLPELNAGVFSFALGLASTQPAGITGYCTPVAPATTCQVNTLAIIGSNPNLKAERGKNWQIGADYSPHFVPGLKLSATYYNLTYSNKLGGSGINAFNAFASADYVNQFRSLIIPISNPAGCTNGNPSTYDPKLVEYANFLYYASAGFDPKNYCAIQAVADGRSVSVGKAYQQGLDLNLTYFTQTDIGTFGFNVNASHIFLNKQQVNATDPLVDVLDTINNPLSWRGRGGVSYSNGPLSATLFGNYVGGYRNNVPASVQGTALPQADIPSWTTFDANLAFSFPAGEERWRFMRGVRLGLSVVNLFDKDPPIVLSGTGSSIDQSAHNAMGRYMQVQLSKSF